MSLLQTLILSTTVTQGQDLASTRMFSSEALVQQACGSYYCDAGELASSLQGNWMCPQYTATNPATHQQVLCLGSGQWQRNDAAPANCQFSNKWQCQRASNNCWTNPSDSCENWCQCYNYASGASARLGASLQAAAAQVDDNDADSDDLVLGHSGGGSNDCPFWLPQAQGQLSPGSVGYTCWNQGQFCAYPSYGMNFVCNGNNGVWELQGSNTPAPAPVYACPSWWNIWSGWTRCSNGNGFICRYPEHDQNYICSNGFWMSQNNPPTPTPAPINPVNCPPNDHYLNSGDYCTSPGQLCVYGNLRYKCINGVWM